jgi:NADP-dependent 3-hydroxy acid dehydrogenase YdfG
LEIGPILLTGTSGRIGRAIIELLIKKNCHIYAAARKKEDLEELSNLPNVTSLKCNKNREY